MGEIPSLMTRRVSAHERESSDLRTVTVRRSDVTVRQSDDGYIFASSDFARARMFARG
jgi:hypothetical protein